MLRGLDGLTRGLGSLAYPQYRRFAVSLLLSALALNFVQTAILWQVYQLTGSALLLGVTGLVRAAPYLGFSLVGGVLADRFNRVVLVQAGQVTNVVLLVILGVLTTTGRVELWHIYVYAFCNGATTALTNPSRAALIPWLVPRERLVNAIGLNATISQTSQIVGPALSGVAIAVLDLGSAYMVTALAYGIAVFAIAGVRVQRVSSRPTINPWHSLQEGLVYIRQKPVIVSLLAIDVAQEVLGSYRALLPVIADLINAGEVGYGLLSAAPGVGNLLGAFVMLSLGDMRYKGIYALSGVLGFSVTLVLLAFSSWFPLAFLAAALLGLANAVQMIPRNSAILSIPPDEMRGRVEAFRSMLAGGGPPLGYALSGALAAAIGVPFTLTIGAACCAALIGGLWVGRPELRDPHLGATSA